MPSGSQLAGDGNALRRRPGPADIRESAAATRCPRRRLRAPMCRVCRSSAAVAGQRGEDLRAVDAPAAIDLDRACAVVENALRCRDAAALPSENDCEYTAAVADDARVVLCANAPRASSALLRRRGRDHRSDGAGPQRRADVHVERQRGRAAVSAEFGGHHDVSREIGAEARRAPAARKCRATRPRADRRSCRTGSSPRDPSAPRGRRTCRGRAKTPTPAGRAVVSSVSKHRRR